jgi:hypothetical protein
MTSGPGENKMEEDSRDRDVSDDASSQAQQEPSARAKKDENTLAKRWEETQNSARTRVQSLRMAWSRRRSELERQAEEARELYDEAAFKHSPYLGQGKKNDQLIVMTSMNKVGDMLWNQTTVYPAKRYHISHLPFARGRKRLVANVRSSPWSENSITSRHRPTTQNTDASSTNRHATPGSGSWLSFQAPSSEGSPAPLSPMISRTLLQSGTGMSMPTPPSAHRGDPVTAHRGLEALGTEHPSHVSEMKTKFSMSEGTETLLMHGKVEPDDDVMAPAHAHAHHAEHHISTHTDSDGHPNPIMKVRVQMKPPSPVKIGSDSLGLFNKGHAPPPLHDPYTNVMALDDDDEEIHPGTPLAEFLHSHNAMFNVQHRHSKNAAMADSLPAIKRGGATLGIDVHIDTTGLPDMHRQSTKTGSNNPAKTMPLTFPMHTPSHTPYSPRQILTMVTQSKTSKRDDTHIAPASRGWQTERGTHRNIHTGQMKQHVNAGSLTERGSSRTAYLSHSRSKDSMAGGQQHHSSSNSIAPAQSEGTGGDMHNYDHTGGGHVGRVQFDEVQARSTPRKKLDLASWCKAADVLSISPHRQVLGCRHLTSDDYEVGVCCW